MKQYKVQITDKALSDMEEIYNYIAIQLRAPENAMGQYDRIAKAIEDLNIFPEKVRLMESEQERSMGLRQLVVDNYSVFYVIESESVIVIPQTGSYTFRSSLYIFCFFFTGIIQKISFWVFFRPKKAILSRNIFNKNPSTLWALIYFF